MCPPPPATAKRSAPRWCASTSTPRCAAARAWPAADRCLNTAAGVLSLALDGMGTETTLIRLEDGVFLVVAVGVSARELENCLQEALRNARRNFGITLARRGEFTATVASADWVETGSWDLMVSLAESRLYNP